MADDTLVADDWTEIPVTEVGINSGVIKREGIETVIDLLGLIAAGDRWWEGIADFYPETARYVEHRLCRWIALYRHEIAPKRGEEPEDDPDTAEAGRVWTLADLKPNVVCRLPGLDPFYWRIDESEVIGWCQSRRTFFTVVGHARDLDISEVVGPVTEVLPKLMRGESVYERQDEARTIHLHANDSLTIHLHAGGQS